MYVRLKMNDAGKSEEMMRSISMTMVEENPKKLDVLGQVARGNWSSVMDLYKKYPESRRVKIPRTGDTALHVAVSDERHYVVENMVAVAGSDELAMGNGQGNTPLHLAATLGNTDICKCFAEKDGRLIGARNDYGETPIFSAVTRGRTQAFLYLHNFCKDKEYVYYRRNNGDTVLHSAISERHFDLAYIIIKEYPKLVERVNEEGLSPLHLLATKLSVFPSGVQVFGIHKLVYRCMRVRKLEELHDPAKALNHLSEGDIKHSSCIGKCFNYIFHLFFFTACCGKSERHEATTTKQIDSWEHPEDEEAANVGQEFAQENLPNKYIVNRLENQQDTEVPNRQVDRKIYQQDEEATKEQVDNQENLQEDHETSSSGKGFKRSRGYKVLGAICTCCICPFIVLHVCYICTLMLLYELASVALKLAKYVIGYEKYIGLRHVKERSVWSVEVMNKLLECKSKYPYEQRGMRPDPPKEEHDRIAQLFEGPAIEMVEAPILIGAKNGVVEMVLGILDVHPDAIFDVNAENKNIAMLAVEHRQPHLYEVLLSDWRIKQTIFGQVDKNGNSLLHIAANHGVGDQQEFWHIRGAALQLHMEVKWYKFVKHSMPPRFFARYNNFRQTPKEIFQESHRSLIEEGRQWLTSTSQSCSVVAALIATVAFATSAAVPGGLDQDSGAPTLEHKPVFVISATSSLVALSSSMISVVMFLGILTSSFKLKDFRKDLPNKLLLGLISLLISIVSMLVSFYAGHLFVLRGEFVHSAIAIYTLLCFPLVFFIISKFPLDLNIVWTTLSNKPRK